MSAKYSVKVNDTFHFDLDNESVKLFDAVSIKENKYHILHQKTPYKAEVVSSEFNQKKYTVNVNNNTYVVAISNPLDLLIKDMGFEVGKAKQVNVIKAPMPGLILEIGVEVGQIVHENDCLLILTAMKMENSFLSPRDGVIKSIAIAVGDSVIKGDLLIEFE
jgi:biotin carboxyl carrier protein